jgi:uncharacterized protein DUF6412
MLLWAVVAVVSIPALEPSQLVFGGLAVVVAALLIVAAAAGLPLPTSPGPAAWRVAAQRAAARHPYRLADPDAAGRPRPRAPTAYPTAA